MSRVSSDLIGSLMSGSLAILIVIALLFRSVLQAVLSMVPNVLTLVVGYGAMGALGWPLEPAPAVVFTIAIGLAVDSAIHVIARFDEEQRAGHSVDASLSFAILHSGRAILVTSLLVVLGFATNAFSSSPATASFGKLGTLIIIVGLVANVVVLPAMLKIGYGTREKRLLARAAK
jgi:predicted RND superfamily exporter protein